MGDHVTREWVEKAINQKIYSVMSDLDTVLSEALQELARRISDGDRDTVAWVGVQLNDLRNWVEQQLGSSNTATTGVISITDAQGGPMSITVDTTTGQASFTFKDDKGDTVPTPDGATLTWETTDSPPFLSIDSASGAISGPFTVGEATIKVTISGVTLSGGQEYTATVPVLAGSAEAFTVSYPEVTVDSSAVAPTVEWTDDKGDVLSTPPVGATFAYTTDTTEFATMDPSTGELTGASEGTVNVTATVSGVTLPDGTDFAPVTVAVSVAGGAATTGEITVTP